MQSLSASPCRGARPQRTRNVPPRGVFVRSTRGAPSRSTSVPKAATAPCTICPKSRLRAPSTVPGRTTVRERSRPRAPAATGQPLCRSLAEAPRQRAAERDEHTSTWGDLLPPPRGGGCVGDCPPPGRLQTRLPPRAGLSPTGRRRRRASPGREHRADACVEFLLTLRVGFACRCCGAVTVGEATARQLIRRVACGVTSKRKSVETADVHLVRMFIRLEPRDRLVVLPQVKVGPTAQRPRCPAAQQVVSERAQVVYHRKHLEDVPQVVPLRRRQLAALVRHRAESRSPRWRVYSRP